MTIANVQGGRQIAQFNRGQNINVLAVESGFYNDSQLVGPFTNPYCRGVRVFLYLASVDTGYEATAHATLLTGGIATIAMDTVGNGYASDPTVVITDPTGTGAAAHAVRTGLTVTSVVVDTAGTGYTAPVISFTGGGTSGTIKVGIETTDLVLGTASTLLESAALSSTGLKGPYTVYPGAVVSANVSANAHVGSDFYIRLTNSAAGQWAYAMTVQFLA